MASFDLQIVTPRGTRFDGKAESLTVNTSAGMITIMAGHTDYMAAVTIGKAKTVSDGVSQYAVCGSGFLSVLGGKCTLIAGSFDVAADLDEEAVKADLANAEVLLQDAKTEADKQIAKEKKQLAILRLSLFE